jgi:hypothetical protein
MHALMLWHALASVIKYTSDLSFLEMLIRALFACSKKFPSELGTISDSVEFILCQYALGCFPMILLL